MLKFKRNVLAIALLALIPTSISISDDDVFGKKPTPTPFEDWDYLVYSQRWPVTSCSEWEEKSSGNKCNMPQNKTIWNVHGVWPTKIGEDGPFFCNSAVHFDPEQLTPILKQLQEFWTNIEGNTKPNSFWKHEWDKHGTCAVTLPQLNSVINYFSRGLQWNQEYNLADILSKNNIVPKADGYTVEEIYNAVRSAINKNPIVQCDVDEITKDSLISEIRICFNKTLDLIDCNVGTPNGTTGDILLSNCNLKKPVMYYPTVPNPTTPPPTDDYDEEFIQECLENYRYRETLWKIFETVKFLIWFTM